LSPNFNPFVVSTSDAAIHQMRVEDTHHLTSQQQPWGSGGDADHITHTTEENGRDQLMEAIN